MECPPWNPTGGFQGIKIMETKSNRKVKPSESQRIRNYRHSPRNPHVHSHTWNYFALLSAKSLAFTLFYHQTLSAARPCDSGGLPVHLLYMKITKLCEYREGPPRWLDAGIRGTRNTWKSRNWLLNRSQSLFGGAQGSTERQGVKVAAWEILLAFCQEKTEKILIS